MKRAWTTCSFVLPALPMSVCASRLPTPPRSSVSDPHHQRRCSSSASKKSTKHTQLLQCICPCTQLVLYAAGLRWKLRMNCVEFPWFCERVVSGVMKCTRGVKCRFVPFDRISSIEQACPHCFSLLLRAPLTMHNS